MPITTDIKLSFEQYDMTPGNPGRRFRRNLLIHGTKSDEAGFSVADTLARSDEGAVDAAGNPAPGAPTIPAAANTANDKRRALRVTRVKNSFSFLVAHISDEPTKTLLADPPFFQNGPTAYDYVMGEVLIPVDQGQLNEMTLTWLTMTIISYVGYNENSVNEMVKVMRVLNMERPQPDQFSDAQILERLLDMIAKESSHLALEAQNELNASEGVPGQPGVRMFQRPQVVPPPPIDA